MPPRTPKTPAKRKATQVGRGVTPVRLRNIEHLVPPKEHTPFHGDQDLIFMALDIAENSGGACFRIWGTTQEGSSVLLTVNNFEPYFYIAAPKRPKSAPPGDPGSGFEPGVKDCDIEWDKDLQQLRMLSALLNRTIDPENKIQRIEVVHKRPILYYRPEAPDGGTFLKLVLKPGGNARRAGTQVLKTITNKPGLRFHGFVWRDQVLYEHEVSPLQRFLADVPLFSGAWLCIPPLSHTATVAGGGKDVSNSIPTPHKGGEASSSVETSTDVSIGGYSLAAPSQRVSHADIEATAPWRSVLCLSPDATQLADTAWSPFARLSGSGDRYCPSEAAEHAAEAARHGEIAPLRMLVMDVCCATRDGQERAPVPSQGDPVIAISCSLVMRKNGNNNDNININKPRTSSESGKSEKTAVTPSGGVVSTIDQDSVEIIDLTSDGDGDLGDEVILEDDGDGSGGVQVIAPSVAAVVGGPRSSQQHAAAPEGPRSVVFVLAPPCTIKNSPLEGLEESALSSCRELSSGADMVLCSTEAELLLTWQDYVMRSDPDVISVFQVGAGLEAIAQRFAALGLGATSRYGGPSAAATGSTGQAAAGALQLSRYTPQHSTAIQIRRITMYSAAWVKSQSRMSSTSNQETFKAEIDGRVVVDVLRQVLTSCNLGSFTLVDCVQSLMGETMEVLGAHSLAALVGITPPNAGGGVSKNIPSPRPDPVRVARYSLRRAAAVRALLVRLATIPEAIEIARATGLTIGQVQYNAQMIRSWSLLLRVAQRQGIVINSRSETSPLSEHTFILHPVEAGTTGLYRQPVAILDFASLYPSIYRAYNLCYTTLIHPEDAKVLPQEHLAVTPTGAIFTKSEVRQGILPSILAALISARAATRAQLATATSPAQRAVLDSRQKALKVTANALYGFTGAQASPLQCVQLADSCLAYGAQSCRRAKEVLEAAAASGELGPPGRGARVIYGHTDSLFLQLPAAGSIEIAIQTGQKAAAIVTAAFPRPIELKFERVCSPLLLLHVNRYAGRDFERESDVPRGGDLIVKGLKSMWRQTAPIVRTMLHGSLVRILMEDDVSGAVEFVKGEIRRLLSGHVEIYELVMTGGLWRVTGEQVERAAANESGAGPSGGFDPGEGAGGGEVRGPHAALAVRLSQRDPGRSFVLGERLQYVLTAGHKLQDDAAEDPYQAARAGLSPDYDLYWKNKILRPLSELFATCLTPQQLQNLVSGPHTMVKVDRAAKIGGNGASGSAGGPLSPSPGKGSSRGGAKQLGMLQFFKATAKCLGCRQAMSRFRGAPEDAPGLCDSCAGEEDRWAQAFLAIEEEETKAEARNAAAHAACRQCHSGLLCEEVLCDNGECPVTYARLSSQGTLRSTAESLRRLDIF